MTSTWVWVLIELLQSKWAINWSTTKSIPAVYDTFSSSKQTSQAACARLRIEQYHCSAIADSHKKWFNLIWTVPKDNEHDDNTRTYSTVYPVIKLWLLCLPLLFSHFTPSLSMCAWPFYEKEVARTTHLNFFFEKSLQNATYSTYNVCNDIIFC